MGDTTVRVLLAVIAQPNPSVRSVARAVGRSTQRAHHHLTLLREEGLVDWEPGKTGTLRPLVRVIPFGGET